MKILSDALQQAQIDVIVAFRNIQADKYSAQKLHDEFPALDEKLEELDRIASGKTVDDAAR